MDDSSCAAPIPAHNESSTIAQLVRQSLEYVSRVVVVDDGSSDGTGHLAHKAGAHVLRHPTCCGLGAALRNGLAYLKAAHIDTVITLDGDGAHDPTQIPGLLKSHMQQRADLTIDTRFAASSPPIPSPKAAANYFATALVNRVLGSNVSDAAWA